MLDEDLSELYGVQTRRLIEQVKRNIDRFPSDFMFQLTKDEAAALRSQSATSKEGRGGRRYAPYVFTEQGVAMLSGVLRGRPACRVSTSGRSASFPPWLRDQQLADRGAGAPASCLARIAGTPGDLAPARLQAGPLPISVEHDPALVDGSKQKRRCGVLYAVQPRHVHVATRCALEAHSELDRRVGTVLSEGDQQVQV